MDPKHVEFEEYLADQAGHIAAAAAVGDWGKAARILAEVVEDVGEDPAGTILAALVTAAAAAGRQPLLALSR